MDKIFNKFFYELSMWKVVIINIIVWSTMALIMFNIMTPPDHPEMDKALHMNYAIYKISATLGTFIGLMQSLGIWVIREKNRN